MEIMQFVFVLVVPRHWRYRVLAHLALGVLHMKWYHGMRLRMVHVR